jgi:hypothetical protein
VLHGALGGGLDGACCVSSMLLNEKLFGLVGSLDILLNEKAGVVLAGCSSWGEIWISTFSSSNSDVELPDSETSVVAKARVEGVGGSMSGLAWVQGSGSTG